VTITDQFILLSEGVLSPTKASP